MQSSTRTCHYKFILTLLLFITYNRYRATYWDLGSIPLILFIFYKRYLYVIFSYVLIFDVLKRFFISLKHVVSCLNILFYMVL